MTPDFVDIITHFEQVLAMPRVNLNKNSIERWRIENDLKDSLKLDPSGLTTMLMLRAVLASICEAVSVPYMDLIKDPQGVQSELSTIENLNEKLSAPYFQEHNQHYRDTLKAALKRNKLPVEKYQSLIDDDSGLAWLRRDTLYGMQNLSEHQFTRGERASGELIYSDSIYCYPDLHRCLLQTLKYDNHVAMSMIKSSAAEAYFVFVVKNGGNVYVLHDLTRHENPFCQRRKPMRDLHDRAAKFVFPYELIPHQLIWGLDPQGNLEARVKYLKDDGLQKYGMHGFEIGKISEIEPYQTLWALMMFSSIREKYEVQDRQLEALSFTGFQLAGVNELSALADSLPVKMQVPVLPLSPLAVEDVLHENSTADQMGSRLKVVSWWEKRYVPRLTQAAQSKALDIYDPLNLNGGLMGGHLFGTAEQLDQDRRFAARMKLADEVRALMEAEFKERREEMCTWYAKKVEKNRQRILELIAGALKGQKPGASGVEVAVVVGKGLKIYSSGYSLERHQVSLKGIPRFKPKQGFDPACVLTGARAKSKITYVKPITAEGIAHLFGCRVEDLHELYQVYEPEDRYYAGNSNLQRVDPMLTNVTHLFRSTLFPSVTIAVYLSELGEMRLRSWDVPAIEPSAQEARDFSSHFKVSDELFEKHRRSFE